MNNDTFSKEDNKCYIKNLKNKFMKSGIKAFNSSEILELILSFSAPRSNVRKLAADLLKKFGSIARVLDAKPDVLIKMKDISESTVVLLKLIPDICRVVKIEESLINKTDNTIPWLKQFIINQFIGFTTEHIVLILLDKKSNILFCDVVSKGGATSASVNLQDVVLTALRFSAESAIVAHNHTNGLALPSDEDMSFTYKISDALECVGIKLLDHLVVAEDIGISISGYFD